MISLKNKSNFLRFGPVVIILIVIIFGITAIFLFQGHSIDLKQAQNSALQDLSSTSSNNTKLPNKTVLPSVFDITKRSSSPSTSNETDYVKWMLSNTSENKDYITAKWDRSRAIITNQDVSDPRILEAFLRTPREFFGPAGTSAIKIYGKYPIPIGYGQTISGPHLVARMTQAIDPRPEQKVLEIGTGSGFQSAVLSELSNYVYTIEIVPQLAQRADALYTKLTKVYPEYANIIRKNADGYYGWRENAPFDRIIVTAGIDHVPPDLLSQLVPGGIMVIPVGPPSGQTILKITKEVAADGSITFKREDIYNDKKVIFVPFTSVQGTHSNTSN